MSIACERVLVTGAAGFIGFSLARRLLENGRVVVGVDCVNDCYDPVLKEKRLVTASHFTALILQIGRPLRICSTKGVSGR